MSTNYIEKYKMFLRTDSNDSIISINKDLVNDNFNQALFTEYVVVDDIEQTAIVKQKKKSEDKNIIFKPDTKLNIGSIVEWKNKPYLIIDFLGEGIYEMYPTATVKLCNSAYPIKLNKTETIVGHNQLGKPISKDVYEIDKQEPCVVEMGIITTSTDKQLVIPNNQILVTIKYQQSDTLKENHEFTMFNNKYKIIHIDYTKVINEKGIIKITAERV